MATANDLWLEVARNMTIETSHGGPGPREFQLERVDTRLEWERGNPNPVRVVVSLWESNCLGERRLTEQKTFTLAEEVR